MVTGADNDVPDAHGVDDVAESQPPPAAETVSQEEGPQALARGNENPAVVRADFDYSSIRRVYNDNELNSFKGREINIIETCYDHGLQTKVLSHLRARSCEVRSIQSMGMYFLGYRIADSPHAINGTVMYEHPDGVGALVLINNQIFNFPSVTNFLDSLTERDRIPPKTREKIEKFISKEIQKAEKAKEIQRAEKAKEIQKAEKAQKAKAAPKKPSVASSKSVMNPRPVERAEPSAVAPTHDMPSARVQPATVSEIFEITTESPNDILNVITTLMGIKKIEDILLHGIEPKESDLEPAFKIFRDIFDRFAMQISGLIKQINSKHKSLMSRVLAFRIHGLFYQIAVEGKNTLELLDNQRLFSVKQIFDHVLTEQKDRRDISQFSVLDGYWRKIFNASIEMFYIANHISVMHQAMNLSELDNERARKGTRKDDESDSSENSSELSQNSDEMAVATPSFRSMVNTLFETLRHVAHKLIKSLVSHCVDKLITIDNEIRNEFQSLDVLPYPLLMGGEIASETYIMIFLLVTDVWSYIKRFEKGGRKRIKINHRILRWNRFLPCKLGEFLKLVKFNKEEEAYQRFLVNFEENVLYSPIPDSSTKDIVMNYIEKLKQPIDRDSEVEIPSTKSMLDFLDNVVKTLKMKSSPDVYARAMHRILQLASSESRNRRSKKRKARGDEDDNPRAITEGVGRLTEDIGEEAGEVGSRSVPSIVASTVGSTATGGAQTTASVGGDVVGEEQAGLDDETRAQPQTQRRSRAMARELTDLVSKTNEFVGESVESARVRKPILLYKDRPATEKPKQGANIPGLVQTDNNRNLKKIEDYQPITLFAPRLTKEQCLFETGDDVGIMPVRECSYDSFTVEYVTNVTLYRALNRTVATGKFDNEVPFNIDLSLMRSEASSKQIRVYICRATIKKMYPDSIFVLPSILNFGRIPRDTYPLFGQSIKNYTEKPTETTQMAIMNEYTSVVRHSHKTKSHIEGDNQDDSDAGDGQVQGRKRTRDSRRGRKEGRGRGNRHNARGRTAVGGEDSNEEGGKSDSSSDHRGASGDKQRRRNETGDLEHFVGNIDYDGIEDEGGFGLPQPRRLTEADPHHLPTNLFNQPSCFCKRIDVYEWHDGNRVEEVAINYDTMMSLCEKEDEVDLDFTASRPVRSRRGTSTSLMLGDLEDDNPEDQDYTLDNQTPSAQSAATLDQPMQYPFIAQSSVQITQYDVQTSAPDPELATIQSNKPKSYDLALLNCYAHVNPVIKFGYVVLSVEKLRKNEELFPGEGPSHAILVVPDIELEEKDSKCLSHIILHNHENECKISGGVYATLNNPGTSFNLTISEALRMCNGANWKTSEGRDLHSVLRELGGIPEEGSCLFIGIGEFCRASGRRVVHNRCILDEVDLNKKVDAIPYISFCAIRDLKIPELSFQPPLCCSWDKPPKPKDFRFFFDDCFDKLSQIMKAWVTGKGDSINLLCLSRRSLVLRHNDKIKIMKFNQG